MEESTIVSKHFIIVNGTYLGDFKCSIVNIHAPNDVGERKRLWDEFLLLKSYWANRPSHIVWDFVDPWCLGGDMNEVKTIDEIRGYSTVSFGSRFKLVRGSHGQIFNKDASSVDWIDF